MYYVLVFLVTFAFATDGASSSTVQIDTLECTKYNSICQANVVLIRRLEPGRYYDFKVSVKDTRGGMTMQSCSITATNYTTPHDMIFPHKAGIIMVPEVSITQNRFLHHSMLQIFIQFFCCFDFVSRIGCKTWHNARLCYCPKESTSLEGCNSGASWVAVVCYSPKNCFTTNNRRHHHFVGTIRF